MGSGAGEITLIARDPTGNVVGQATTSGADLTTPQELSVSGQLISWVELRGGSHEGVLVKYCIETEEQGEVKVIARSELVFSLQPAMTLTHFEEPVRWKVRRCCFAGMVQLPPSEPSGAWNAVLTVQNVNHVPEGTNPVQAATVIGGHILTANAQALGCAAFMLSDHTFDVI